MTTKRYTVGPKTKDHVYSGECHMLDRGVIIPDVIIAESVIDDISDACEITGGHFFGGHFYGGVYEGGSFWHGEFYDGTFRDGDFDDGDYYAGIFNDGIFHDGEFYGGVWRDVDAASGEFYHINNMNAVVSEW